MKKIFTLIAALFLAGLSTIKADQVTCFIYDWKWNHVGESIKADLSYDAETGIYTLNPFLNSGNPVQFTLGEFILDEEDTSSKYADITLVGNVDVEADDDIAYYYLLDADGDDMVCEVDNIESGETTVIDYPYVFCDGYSWVCQNVYYEEDGINEFEGCICLSGYDSTAKKWMSGGYYIYFYYDAPAAVKTIEADALAPVEYFNLQGIKVANPENGVFIRRQGSKVQKVVR